MLIRKNTKAFKTIQEIIRTCLDRPEREKLIRLYITKAGHSIQDRINVEGIQGDASLFYDLNYNAVLSNLESSDRQLQQSDDIPGIYFFHRTSNKAWDETPFEFDEAIKKEFADLPDLPTLRKKEKAEKFVFPVKPVTSESGSKKSDSGKEKKEKIATKKVAKIIDKGPRQPDYKLKRKIEFTDLDKVIFRNPQVTKRDVLDYYNRMSDYILPYLKDRPLSIRTISKEGRMTEYKTVEDLADRVDLPAWIQTTSKKDRAFLCNDKDHLLFYVEAGGIEFGSRSARTKTPGAPDYIVINLECDSDFKRTIDGALTAQTVLSGLQLPAHVKTNGRSGLDIYLPLDAKSKFEAAKSSAECICKLIRLKVPDLVTLKGSDDHSYGKVTLDYLVNEENGIVSTPYSLIAGESPTVATPLLWDEVADGFQWEDFNEDTILKRLKQHGDPFETLFRKKINAQELLERLDDNYAFLF